MFELFPDFEWKRDPTKGFTLEKERRWTETDAPAQPAAQRFGFIREIAEEPTKEPASRIVVAEARINRGPAQLVAYRPLARASRAKGDPGTVLLKRFLRVVTPEDLLDFINDYGPLTGDGFGFLTGEPIKKGLDLARFCWRLVHLRDTGRIAEFKKACEGEMNIPLHTRFVPVAGEAAVKLVMSPHWLDGLILFLLAQRLLPGGRMLRECRFCSDIFEVGPGTGKRGDREYCKDEHKTAFFNQPEQMKRRRP